MTRAIIVTTRRAAAVAMTPMVPPMLNRVMATVLTNAGAASRCSQKPVARRISVVLHRMWVDDADFPSDIPVHHAT
ncbi:hypothetical protein RSWS8N_19199 [Cereibacter sphaeroides WS8N]|nr:hypothetical protein RSWS8N_19199 [Cereibacter sphaeroides WS8N]